MIPPPHASNLHNPTTKRVQPQEFHNSNLDVAHSVIFWVPQDSEQLARARPALAGQVTAPRQELRALWAQVEAAAAAKGRGLAEAARAESCAQACAGLRSWLAGVRAQLRSGHCGQDLTSVGVLLTRHQVRAGGWEMATG